MKNELYQYAKERVQNKITFYVQAALTVLSSTILIIMSSVAPFEAAIWLMASVGIQVIALIYAYLKLVRPQIPQSWKEREIEKEMDRLSRLEKQLAPPADDLSENEQLELKELERLKQKWETGDGYV